MINFKNFKTLNKNYFLPCQTITRKISNRLYGKYYHFSIVLWLKVIDNDDIAKKFHQILRKEFYFSYDQNL